MSVLGDVVEFAARLAEAGCDGDFELRLPRAAVESIKADADLMRRLDCAANADGVLAFWGPTGVVVIRERVAPTCLIE